MRGFARSLSHDEYPVQLADGSPYMQLFDLDAAQDLRRRSFLFPSGGQRRVEAAFAESLATRAVSELARQVLQDWREAYRELLSSTLDVLPNFAQDVWSSYVRIVQEDRYFFSCEEMSLFARALGIKLVVAKYRQGLFKVVDATSDGRGEHVIISVEDLSLIHI